MQMALKVTANIQCDKCGDRMQLSVGGKHGGRALNQSREWRRRLEDQAWAASHGMSEGKPGREREGMKSHRTGFSVDVQEASLWDIPRNRIAGPLGINTLITPSMSIWLPKRLWDHSYSCAWQCVVPSRLHQELVLSKAGQSDGA